MDLSLIIPVYNTRKWLIECLDSAKAAIDGIDAEVLLIDDGSTDDSGLIAKEYAEKNPSFHYYHKENGGISSARNFGISHARGKYLAFLDSDDKVADWIYRDMLYMSELHGTPLAICNVTYINEKNKVLAAPLYQKTFSNLSDPVASIRTDPILAYDTSVWNKLILRSFWNEHDLSFPEGYFFEDGPVALRLHWYADKVSILPGFGYLYRKYSEHYHDGSGSVTQQVFSMKKLQDKLLMEKDILSFIKDRIDEPGAREILNSVQKKIVGFSIEPLIMNLYKADQKVQEQFISQIGEFLSEEISEKALEELSLYHNSKYRLLTSGNRESLLQLTNHKRLAWRTMPVIEQDDIPMLKLPVNIYGRAMTPAAKELQDDIPLTRIRHINKSEDKIFFDMTVYYPRINVLQTNIQKISAFLFCEFTGEKIELKTETRLSPELTKECGTMVCMDDFRVYRYNYDGAGCNITVDLNDLWKHPAKGRWHLGINYETPVAKGSRLVRSISPAAKKTITDDLSDLKSVNIDGSTEVSAKFDLRESFYFEKY